MWNEQTVKQILEQVRRGDAETEEALRQLKHAAQSFPMAFLDEATVDLGRETRCGYAEVVYAEGKSIDTVVEIFTALVEHGGNALATRVSADQAAALVEQFPEAIHHPLGRTVRLNRDDEPRDARVAVIAAGTTDLPVAWEAVETLRWMRLTTDLVTDVGVAGPQRLPSQIERIRSADAVVVVAGMEGALPSVVGGYVDCPVVAVPTSVGYGANFGGLAALLSMMNSCAAGVTVVNVDAGFKGGYVAGLIAGRLADVRDAHGKQQA